MSLHYHAWNCKLCYYTIHCICALPGLQQAPGPGTQRTGFPGGHTGRPYAKHFCTLPFSPFCFPIHERSFARELWFRDLSLRLPASDGGAVPAAALALGPPRPGDGGQPLFLRLRAAVGFAGAAALGAAPLRRRTAAAENPVPPGRGGRRGGPGPGSAGRVQVYVYLFALPPGCPSDP